MEPDPTRVSRFQDHWLIVSVLYPPKPPAAQGSMRVVALIDDPQVVRRILEHLGRWVPLPAARGPPAQAADWPPGAVIPLSYHPVPDIA